MPNVVAVDPFRCRMWQGHERLEEGINEETCRAEIDSFLTHGQKLPVLGRVLKDDGTHDFELVYGARRLFVARHLNVLLSMEVRELTDREAIIALDIENRQRKELSPYERGRSYQLWLKNGFFPSQEALARALNISASQVSRLINLAQLPPVIINAFATPLEICESWGRDLLELWDDPRKKRVLIAAAQAISRDPVRRPAAAVFKRLAVAACDTSDRRVSVQTDSRDEVVKGKDGSPLFRVRQHRNDTALLLPVHLVSPKTLSEIKQEVAQILHRARSQGTDFAPQRSPSRVGAAPPAVKRQATADPRPAEPPAAR